MNSFIVYAFEQPPFADMKLLKAFSSGYFELPMKIICSKKWASPYLCLGSLYDPALTASAIETLLGSPSNSSVFKSLISRHVIPFGNLNK